MPELRRARAPHQMRQKQQADQRGGQTAPQLSAKSPDQAAYKRLSASAWANASGVSRSCQGASISSARSRLSRASRRMPSESEQFPSLLERVEIVEQRGSAQEHAGIDRVVLFDVLADVHDPVAAAADLGGIVDIEDAVDVGIDAEDDFSGRKVLPDHHPGCLRLEEVVRHQ